MALFKRAPAGKPGEWYYCLKHGKVEEGPECPGRERLGPYPTPAQAARALETAQERNEEWDNDPRWNDDSGRGDDSAGGGGAPGAGGDDPGRGSARGEG